MAKYRTAPLNPKGPKSPKIFLGPDEADVTSRRAAIQSIGWVSLLAMVGCGSDEATPNGARHGDAGGSPPPKDDAGAPAPSIETGPPAPPPHPYVDLLRQFVAAFNEHDTDLALSYFADTATFRLNGRVLDGHAKIREFLTEYGASNAGTPLASATMSFAKGLVFPDGVVMIGGRILGAPTGQIAGFTPTSTIANMAFGGVFQVDATNRFSACDVIVDWGGLAPVPT
jgi:hypothetical protein